MRDSLTLPAILAAILIAASLSAPSNASAQNHAAQTPEASSFEKLLEEGIGTNDERLPYHADSWTALAIIALALLTAFALNHAQPHIRTLGTLLASLSCFALFAWFLFTWGSGILANPKPPLLPPDALKPALLTLQALASLGAGIFLLRVTQWQHQRQDELALPIHNAPTQYGLLHRVLHWTTAILFLSLIPMGIFTSMIPEGVWYRQGYYVVHKTIGLTVLMLVLIRLAWRARSPAPPLDPQLQRWERALAHTVHILLYAFLLAFPITGFVMSTFGGKLSHFFFLDTPLFFAPNEGGLLFFGFLHKVALPYIAYILIGAHLLGALKHQFFDKHPMSFRRMAS